MPYIWAEERSIIPFIYSGSQNIPNGYISGDSNGDIWWVTIKAGLHRYNKNTGAYTLYTSGTSGLVASSGSCSYMCAAVDIYDNVWVLVAGLNPFNTVIQKFTPSTGAWTSYSIAQVGGFFTSRRNRIAISSDGKIAIGIYDSTAIIRYQIAVYNPGTDTWSSYHVNTLGLFYEIVVDYGFTNSGDGIWTSIEDFSCPGNSISLYNFSTGVVEAYRSATSNLVQDTHEALYVDPANDDCYLVVRNGTDHYLQKISGGIVYNYGAVPNFNTKIIVDNSSYVWGVERFTGGGGITYYDGSSVQEYISYPPIYDDNMGSVGIDRDDDKWFLGQDGAGITLYRFYFVAPPAAPSDLTATAESTTEISLSWIDNSTNEESFSIERKVPGGSFAVIDTVPPDTTDYLDSTCEGATEYVYRVQAINTILGNSGYSNEASAITDTPVVSSSLQIGDGVEVKNQQIADQLTLRRLGIRPARKCYRRGIRNYHALNWSELGGVAWVMPEVGIGMLTVYDDNDRAINLVMDEETGLPYYIGSKNGPRGSNVSKVWRDKEAQDYNVGTEIPWLVRFKEHVGED